MQRLDVQGGVVWYAARGEGSSLVFIHGAGTSGTTWSGDLAPLADACRVITYDRRGYGASSAAPPTWATHRDDAARVIEALHAAPAVVAACGMGAIAALGLAFERPDLVAALVLVEPALAAPAAGQRRAYLRAHAVRAMRGAPEGATAWLRRALAGGHDGMTWDGLPAARRDAVLENAAGLFADLDAGEARLPTHALQAIDCPVTVVRSALAPGFVHRSADRLCGVLPDARLVTLPGAGHAVAFHASDDLLAALRAALRVGGAPEPLPPGVAH
jgi:3-oxoadipate enol-lactonase